MHCIHIQYMPQHYLNIWLGLLNSLVVLGLSVPEVYLPQTHFWKGLVPASKPRGLSQNHEVSRSFKMRSTPAISNSKTVKPVITGQRGQNKKVIKLVRSFNFQTVYFNKADFLRKFIFVFILTQANNIFVQPIQKLINCFQVCMYCIAFQCLSLSLPLACLI
jgi:hypothetical protein